MIKRTMLLVGMLTLAATAAQATSVIGLGIQGRPHGGHTAERMYAWRHGMRYHRHHHYYHHHYRY